MFFIFIYLYLLCRSPFFPSIGCRALLAKTELNFVDILDGLFSYLPACWMCTCHPWEGRARCGWLPNKLESTKLPIQNGTHHLLYTNSMLVNSSRFWTNVYCSLTSANQLPLLLDKNDSEVWKHHLLVAHFSVCHSATLFNINKSHFYYLSCINYPNRGL